MLLVGGVMKNTRLEKENEKKKEQGRNLLAQLYSVVRSGQSLNSLLRVLSQLRDIIMEFGLSISDFFSLSTFINTAISQQTTQNNEEKNNTQAVDKDITEEFKKLKLEADKLFSEIDQDKHKQLFSNVSNSLKSLRNKEATPEEKKESLEVLKQAFNNEEKARSSVIDHHENIIKWEKSLNELEAIYNKLMEKAGKLSSENQKYLEELGKLIPERQKQIQTKREEWYEMAAAHVQFQASKKYCENNNLNGQLDQELTKTFSQEPSHTIMHKVRHFFQELAETPSEKKHSALQGFEDEMVKDLLEIKNQNKDLQQNDKGSKPSIGPHTSRYNNEQKSSQHTKAPF